MNEKPGQPAPKEIEIVDDEWTRALTNEAVDLILERELVLERQAKLARDFPPHELAIHNKLVEDLRQGYGDQSPVENT